MLPEENRSLRRGFLGRSFAEKTDFAGIGINFYDLKPFSSRQHNPSGKLKGASIAIT